MSEMKYFPTYRFHPYEEAKIFQNQEELDKAGPLWFDTPVKVEEFLAKEEEKRQLEEKKYQDGVEELKDKYTSPAAYLLIDKMARNREPLKRMEAILKGEGGETDDNRTFPASTHETLDFIHSPDYRTVTLRGKKWNLTSLQAQIIQILHQAFQKGTPEVSHDNILVEIDRSTSRLRDFFKSRPGAWGELVISGTQKGMNKGFCRLNL